MSRRRSYQKGNLRWHNGHWTVRFWELNHQTGEWKQRRAKLAGCTDRNNKKAAKEAANAFMAEVNERNNNPPRIKQEQTFAAFLDGRWASYQANRTLQASTMSSYQSMIKEHILPALGGRLVREISPSDLTAFFDNLRGKVSAKYASNIYALLNNMFEVAYQHDLIESKPLRSMLHKPKYRPVEKPTLSVEKVEKIINGLEGVHRVLLVVLCVFTVRLGEALALRWMDVDFESEELTIRSALWRGKLKAQLKTRASERKFHIPAAVVQLLAQFREESAYDGAGDFVFCNSVGQPLDPDNLRHRVLYPVMDRLEIKREKRRYGFHIFRHTAGSVLHSKTSDIKLVQETLGHARISTTADTYVHLDKTVADRATEILFEAMIGNCDLSVTQSSQMVS
jgi:integrase